MLRFFVYDPQEEFDDDIPASAIDLAQFLDSPPAWKPALEETLFLLDATAYDALLPLNPFGFLPFLFPQCEEAAKRLAAGKFAIIKTAGDWTAFFLLLNPMESMVRLSFIGSLPNPFGTYFPIEDSPLFLSEQIDQRQLLYDYVKRNMAKLRPDSSFSRAVREQPVIELPSNELIESLRREAVLAKKVCDLS